jgi:hexokinase
MIEIKDKVKHFLKDNEMYYEDIDMDVCCDIFIAEMQAGLEGKDSSLAMIPTYIEAGKGKNPCTPVCITAEGTTFYELKSLKTKVEFYLKSFLEEKHNRFFEIVSVKDATLIGATIAGLTN